MGDDPGERHAFMKGVAVYGWTGRSFIIHCMRHIIGSDRYHLGSIRSARTMKMKIDRLFC